MTYISVPIIGSGQPARDMSLSPQEWVNLYQVIGAAGAKYDKTAYATPGTELYYEIPNGGEVRGQLPLNNQLYVVAGSLLYQVNVRGNFGQIGILSTSRGPVDMISNGHQVMIVDGTFGYVYDLTSGTFGKITSPNFSNPAPSRVTYLSDRAVYAAPNTNQFYVSAIGDFTTWDALDFASAESDPDELILAFSNESELYLMGKYNTEIWEAQPDDNFPFVKRTGILVQYGVAAPFSVVRVDNTLIWLSQNEAGQGMLLTLNGYNPEVITDEFATQRLAKLAHIRDAEAFVFQIDGHVFYAITFPTEQKSFLFDVATRQLITWQSWNQNGVDHEGNPTYTLGRHLSRTFSFFDNKLIVGDYRGGRLLKLSSVAYTDYECGPDDSIVRSITFPILTHNKNRIGVRDLRLDVENGNSHVPAVTTDGNQPLVTVEVSKNGGRTFGYKRIVSIGNLGQYRHMSRLRCFGTAIDWAFKISTNHHSFISIHALILDIDVEDSTQLK
jgi:hypothetical protein